jgi:hypothetical protein
MFNFSNCLQQAEWSDIREPSLAHAVAFRQIFEEMPVEIFKAD